MPDFKDEDGTVYTWDPTSHSYVARDSDYLSADHIPDRGHATGGDNDLFDSANTQDGNYEKTDNPLREGWMAHVAVGGHMECPHCGSPRVGQVMWSPEEGWSDDLDYKCLGCGEFFNSDHSNVDGDQTTFPADWTREAAWEYDATDVAQRWIDGYKTLEGNHNDPSLVGTDDSLDVSGMDWPWLLFRDNVLNMWEDLTPEQLWGAIQKVLQLGEEDLGTRLVTWYEQEHGHTAHLAAPQGQAVFMEQFDGRIIRLWLQESHYHPDDRGLPHWYAVSEDGTAYCVMANRSVDVMVGSGPDGHWIRAGQLVDTPGEDQLENPLEALDDDYPGDTTFPEGWGDSDRLGNWMEATEGIPENPTDSPRVLERDSSYVREGNRELSWDEIEYDKQDDQGLALEIWSEGIDPNKATFIESTIGVDELQNIPEGRQTGSSWDERYEAYQTKPETFAPIVVMDTGSAWARIIDGWHRANMAYWQWEDDKGPREIRCYWLVPGPDEPEELGPDLYVESHVKTGEESECEFCTNPVYRNGMCEECYQGYRDGQLEAAADRMLSDREPGDLTLPEDWTTSHVKTSSVDWALEREGVTQQEVLNAVADLGWSIDDSGSAERAREENVFGIVSDDGAYVWAYFAEGLSVGFTQYGGNVASEEMMHELGDALGSAIYSEHEEAYWELDQKRDPDYYDEMAKDAEHNVEDWNCSEFKPFPDRPNYCMNCGGLAEWHMPRDPDLPDIPDAPPEDWNKEGGKKWDPWREDEHWDPRERRIPDTERRLHPSDRDPLAWSPYWDERSVTDNDNPFQDVEGQYEFMTPEEAEGLPAKSVTQTPPDEDPVMNQLNEAIDRTERGERTVVDKRWRPKEGDVQDEARWFGEFRRGQKVRNVWTDDIGTVESVDEHGQVWVDWGEAGDPDDYSPVEAKDIVDANAPEYDGRPDEPGDLTLPDHWAKLAEVMDPVMAPQMPDLNYVLDYNPEDMSDPGWRAWYWGAVFDQNMEMITGALGADWKQHWFKEGVTWEQGHNFLKDAVMTNSVHPAEIRSQILGATPNEPLQLRWKNAYSGGDLECGIERMEGDGGKQSNWESQVEKLGAAREELPPNVLQAFGDIASRQRQEPEQAMLGVQQAYGGGVGSHAAEHVGDMSHRMNEWASKPTWSVGPDFGYEFLAPKVDRMHRLLHHPYGFEKELEENITNNARFNKQPVEQYRQAIYDAMRAYSEAHLALPAYNRAQWLAREAAVSLGDRDYAGCRSYLTSLKQLIDDPDGYADAVTDYRLDEQGSPRQYEDWPDRFDSGPTEGAVTAAHVDTARGTESQPERVELRPVPGEMQVTATPMTEQDLEWPYGEVGLQRTVAEVGPSGEVAPTATERVAAGELDPHNERIADKVAMPFHVSPKEDREGIEDRGILPRSQNDYGKYDLGGGIGDPNHVHYWDTHDQAEYFGERVFGQWPDTEDPKNYDIWHFDLDPDEQRQAEEDPFFSNEEEMDAAMPYNEYAERDPGKDPYQNEDGSWGAHRVPFGIPPERLKRLTKVGVELAEPPVQQQVMPDLNYVLDYNPEDVAETGWFSCYHSSNDMRGIPGASVDFERNVSWKEAQLWLIYGGRMENGQLASRGGEEALLEQIKAATPDQPFHASRPFGGGLGSGELEAIIDTMENFRSAHVSAPQDATVVDPVRTDMPDINYVLDYNPEDITEGAWRGHFHTGMMESWHECDECTKVGSWQEAHAFLLGEAQVRFENWSAAKGVSRGTVERYSALLQALKVATPNQPFNAEFEDETVKWQRWTIEKMEGKTSKVAEALPEPGEDQAELVPDYGYGWKILRVLDNQYDPQDEITSIGWTDQAGGGRTREHRIEGVYMVSPAQSDYWPPGGLQSDVVPTMSTLGGIYVVDDPSPVLKAYDSDEYRYIGKEVAIALVQCQLRGRCVRHQNGYRAEFAKPYAIKLRHTTRHPGSEGAQNKGYSVSDDGSDDDMIDLEAVAKALRATYQCDVTVEDYTMQIDPVKQLRAELDKLQEALPGYMISTHESLDTIYIHPPNTSAAATRGHIVQFLTVGYGEAGQIGLYVDIYGYRDGVPDMSIKDRRHIAWIGNIQQVAEAIKQTEAYYADESNNPKVIFRPKISAKLAETLAPVMPDANYVLDYNPEDQQAEGWQASVWGPVHDFAWKTMPHHRPNLEEQGFSNKPISWEEAHAWLLQHINRNITQGVVEAVQNATPDQEFVHRFGQPGWEQIEEMIGGPLITEWRIDKADGDSGTIGRLADLEPWKDSDEFFGVEPADQNVELGGEVAKDYAKQQWPDLEWSDCPNCGATGTVSPTNFGLHCWDCDWWADKHEAGLALGQLDQVTIELLGNTNSEVTLEEEAKGLTHTLLRSFPVTAEGLVAARAYLDELLPELEKPTGLTLSITWPNASSVRWRAPMQPESMSGIWQSLQRGFEDFMSRRQLDETCPDCGRPLWERDGNFTWCPSCLADSTRREWGKESKVSMPYHVSPRQNREQIEQEGLRAQEVNHAGNPNAWADGIYYWDTPEMAKSFGDNEFAPKPYDIWEFDLEPGEVHGPDAYLEDMQHDRTPEDYLDDYYHPDNEIGGHVVDTDHIPPERLRRASPYNDPDFSWDTEEVEGALDGNWGSEIYHALHAFMDQNPTLEQFEMWVIENIIGPYNKDRMSEAQSWNATPPDERPGNIYEIENITDPDEMMIIDQNAVNWQKLYEGTIAVRAENEEYRKRNSRVAMAMTPEMWQSVLQTTPFFYHVTHRDRLESIKQKGVMGVGDEALPQGGIDARKGRIYLYSYEQDAMNGAEMWLGIPLSETAILKIDASQLNPSLVEADEDYPATDPSGFTETFGGPSPADYYGEYPVDHPGGEDYGNFWAPEVIAEEPGSGWSYEHPLLNEPDVTWGSYSENRTVAYAGTIPPSAIVGIESGNEMNDRGVESWSGRDRGFQTGDKFNPHDASLQAKERTTAVNPVNYEHAPLTTHEVGLFDRLEPWEKKLWRDRAQNLNRRARIIEEPGQVNGRELHAMAERFDNKCAYCDKDLHWGGGGSAASGRNHPQIKNDPAAGTFDHNHPLKEGGSGAIHNIVPACWNCNQDINQWDVSLKPDVYSPSLPDASKINNPLIDADPFSPFEA